ncbi:MAG TPA: hypothetical protein VJR92_13725 [Gemmatimonadaceae bacterium]|nr:hypothetical protein [Gemmatimonadaceae bacterium]
MLRLPLLAVALMSAPGVFAQQTTVDEGSFTLYVNNQRVGREQFSIKQTQVGGATQLVASANIVRNDKRFEPMLKTDGDGRPLAYELASVAGARRTTVVQAMARGARFSGRVAVDGGRTTERDLPLDASSVVLDDDVVHHFYFVARAASSGGTVPVVVPRRLTRESVVVTRRGEANVEIGNGTLPSRHLIVAVAGGAATDLWVDAAGRVLRLHVASRGFTAVRDEAPR